MNFAIQPANIDFSDLFVPQEQIVDTKSIRGENSFLDVLYNTRELNIQSQNFEWERTLGKESPYSSVKDIITTKPIIAIKGYPYRIDVGAKYVIFNSIDKSYKNVCHTVKAEETTPSGEIITRNSDYPSQQPITLMYKNNKEPHVPNWAVNLPNLKLYGSRIDEETNTNLECVKCIERGLYYSETESGIKRCSPNTLLYFLVTQIAFIDENSLFSEDGKVKLNWVELKPGCSSEILNKGSGKFITQITESNGKVQNINVEYPFLVHIKLTKMYATSSLGVGEYDFKIEQESYYEDVMAIGEIIKQITQSGSSLLLKKDRTNVYVDPYILFNAKLTTTTLNSKNLLVGRLSNDDGDFVNMSKEQKAAMILSIHQQELSSRHLPIFSQESKEEEKKEEKKVESTVGDSFKLPAAFTSKKK